ncbi:hypothetical protein M514_07588 [Trichuris suis]|uniref:Nucleolus and neural progenitor protein-like N-terminal domain-containing protein n=1 Tax=Trichuris suis TaxID=68888 RepID=A0A085NCN0_9BILA|nr:hypothetical protein M514_07588 [Trichuris suis]
MDEREEATYLTAIERLIQEPLVSLSFQYAVTEHTPLDLTGFRTALGRLLSCQASGCQNPFKGVEFYIIDKLTLRLGNTHRHFKLFQLVRRLKRTMGKVVQVGRWKVKDTAKFHATIVSKEDGTLQFPSLEMWRRLLAETIAHAVCLAHVVDDCIQVGWFSCQTIALKHFVRLGCLLLACSAVLFQKALNALEQVDSHYGTIAAWRDVRLKSTQVDQPTNVQWPQVLREIPAISRALQRRFISHQMGWMNEVVNQLKVITSSSEEFVEGALLNIVGNSIFKLSSKKKTAEESSVPVERRSAAGSSILDSKIRRHFSNVKSLKSLGEFYSLLKSAYRQSNKDKAALNILHLIRDSMKKLVHLKKTDRSVAVKEFQGLKKEIRRRLLAK